jgi:hypothetical protein
MIASLIDLFWFNVHYPEAICKQQKHKIKIKSLQKRNPPPLKVSCARTGDEGPTVHIVFQIREGLNEIRTHEKEKNK